MALILAIEPGKNQAQQIALLVKQHLKGAELVTAATADAALAAVGGRIPDLILTPALLPPRDESALTDYLRQLGAAASHVQTIAVPIIEAAKSRTADHGSSGLLGRRREKSQSMSVGCEPAVFAEQIKVYLKQAARERASAGEAAAPAPDEHQGEVPIRIDDFEEIVWLPEQPASAPSRYGEADPDVVELPALEPMPVVEPAPMTRLVESSPVVAPEPVVEKRRPRTDNAATRAFEAEFGLPPSSAAAAPLWRVTEEGIEALSVEPPEVVPELPVVVPEVIVVAEPPPVIVAEPPTRPKTKAPKPPKARKPAPPLDDFAYFDPQQSPFKALIKRLDEIAGLTAESAT